jgi:hypothetical protein
MELEIINCIVNHNDDEAYLLLVNNKDKIYEECNQKIIKRIVTRYGLKDAHYQYVDLPKTLEYLITSSPYKDSNMALINDNMISAWYFSGCHKSLKLFIKLFPEKFTDINDTVVRFVCQFGHIEVVEILVSLFPNKLDIFKFGFCYACLYNKIDIVKFLTPLLFKQNVKEIESALFDGFVVACQRGYDDIIEYLTSCNIIIFENDFELMVNSILFATGNHLKSTLDILFKNINVNGILNDDYKTKFIKYMEMEGLDKEMIDFTKSKLVM